MINDVSSPPEYFNFAAHLLRLNQDRPEKIAYIDDAGRMSYGELDEGVRRMASALKSLDIRREERVLVLMHDNNDWPVAFLGTLFAGIVPVALNTLLNAEDYHYILQHSNAKAAIVSAALLPVLREAMAKGDHDLGPVWVSDAEGSLNDGEINLSQSLQQADRQVQAANTHRDAPGFWLYSSGSTGKPKGTLHTHGNPYWTAELYGKNVLGLTENDICFSAAKLFFAYGLGNALSFPLSVGATTVLMAGRPTPDAVFKRWTTHKPTVFFGAPTGFAGMLASPDLPAKDQVALRLASSAGEALPAELEQRFTAQYGVEIIDGIGSTEMLHIFISNIPGQVKYGTSGYPVPGYGIKLLNDEGNPAADGEIGDLYVKAPSAALMYWNNREKSNETFQGEWAKSGDKYIRNADGSYTYSGRNDDMLKVSGLYVSPFEVEATLIEHAAVLEAAVIGKVDENQLIKPKAFVVLKQADGVDTATLAEELQAFVKERLTPHKYPRTIEFVDALPKTATGKIQRFRLREKEAQEA